MDPNDLVIGASYILKPARDKHPSIDRGEYVYVGACWASTENTDSNLYYFRHPDKKYVVAFLGRDVTNGEVMPAPYAFYLSEGKPYSEFIIYNSRYLMLAQDTAVKGKTCDCLCLETGCLVSMHSTLDRTWVKVTNRKIDHTQLARLILNWLDNVVSR